MRIGMGCKAQTADGPCGPARICNAAARPSSRFHAHGQTLNRFSGRRAGLPHHRGSAPAVHHRLRPPRKPQARHAAGRRHHGRKAPPHRMAGGAALFSGGESGECGMTNALVHKTGAAIQWTRDYGQAHPKQRGILVEWALAPFWHPMNQLLFLMAWQTIQRVTASKRTCFAGLLGHPSKSLPGSGQGSAGPWVRALPVFQ